MCGLYEIKFHILCVVIVESSLLKGPVLNVLITTVPVFDNQK